MLSLRLLSITQDDFEAWKTGSIKDYADEKVKAGNWTAEEAPGFAEQTFVSIPPQGFSTADHYFFSIENPSAREKVGIVWYSINREGKRSFAYIWDFAICEQHRRRGYGSEALRLLEEKWGSRGLTPYHCTFLGTTMPPESCTGKAGYAVTNVNMSKKVA